MGRLQVLAVSAAAWMCTGCHSHYIQATIVNNSGAVVNVVQVEYPHASFGTQQLAPGASFHYRYKLLGTGPVKISYYDAHNGEHAQSGPSLNEGDEGQLDIVLDAANHADFKTRLQP